MTDEKILRAAIDKAFNGGFRFPLEGDQKQWDELSEEQKVIAVQLYLETKVYLFIILSREFARGFFGRRDGDYGEKWRLGLRWLKIADDKLKHLEQFIK